MWRIRVARSWAPLGLDSGIFLELESRGKSSSFRRSERANACALLRPSIIMTPRCQYHVRWPLFSLLKPSSAYSTQQNVVPYNVRFKVA